MLTRIAHFVHAYAVGLTLIVVGAIMNGLGQIFDNGNMDRVTESGQRLLMNTPPEMAMMIGGFGIAFGLFAMFGAAMERNGVRCGALGLDVLDSHF